MILPSITGAVGGGVYPSSGAGGQASQGNLGLQIGGIQTGGSAGGIPEWFLIASLAAVAVFLFRRR